MLGAAILFGVAHGQTLTPVNEYPDYIEVSNGAPALKKGKGNEKAFSSVLAHDCKMLQISFSNGFTGSSGEWNSIQVQCNGRDIVVGNGESLTYREPDEHEFSAEKRKHETSGLVRNFRQELTGMLTGNRFVKVSTRHVEESTDYDETTETWRVE